MYNYNYIWAEYWEVYENEYLEREAIINEFNEMEWEEE